MLVLQNPRCFKSKDIVPIKNQPVCRKNDSITQFNIIFCRFCREIHNITGTDFERKSLLIGVIGMRKSVIKLYENPKYQEIWILMHTGHSLLP